MKVKFLIYLFFQAYFCHFRVITVPVLYGLCDKILGSPFAFTSVLLLYFLCLPQYDLKKKKEKKKELYSIAVPLQRYPVVPVLSLGLRSVRLRFL